MQRFWLRALWRLSPGRPECIELLVQRGADVDQNIDGVGTPLHVACSNQHLSSVEKLLQLGEKASSLGYKWIFV